MEDPGRDGNEGGKLHVTADRVVEPLPVVAQPVPGRLLAGIVGEDTPVPGPQILRLDDAGILVKGDDLLDQGRVGRVRQGSADVLLEAGIGGILVGLDQLVEEGRAAVVLDLVLEDQAPNIGGQAFQLVLVVSEDPVGGRH